MAGKKKSDKWAKMVDEHGRESLINKSTGEIKKSNFAMIDKSIIKDIQGLIKQHPAAAEVLFYFVRIANKQNEIKMSQSDLERDSGFSRSKLQRSISVLNKSRFILIRKVGALNTYFVNDRLFWQKAHADKLILSQHTGQISL